MRKTSFKDIAQELGINVKTLYRVINNEPLVRDATRKRVILALHRHGHFLLNAATRQRIVFDVRKNLYPEQQAMELMKRIPPDEFELVVGWHEEDSRRFFAQIEQAAVVAYFSTPRPELQNKVRELNPDILQINIYGNSGGDILINPDNAACGRIAARYLHESGHRHIAVLAPSHQYGQMQFSRYKSFMAEVITEYPEMTVEKHLYSNDQDYLFAADSFFDRCETLPDAIFITSGWYAYRLYNNAMRNGIRIPDEVSILTIDSPKAVGIMDMDVLDHIAIHPERIIDWAEYYIRNRPLILNGGTLSTLTGVDLQIRGSVSNKNKR